MRLGVWHWRKREGGRERRGEDRENNSRHKAKEEVCKEPYIKPDRQTDREGELETSSDR